MELLLHAWIIFTLTFTAASESGHSSLYPSSSSLMSPSSASSSSSSSSQSQALTESLDSATAEARAALRCQLLSRWEGNWFQSGVHQTITINRSSISTKGKCLEADGEKFLVYNEKENCHRCVVFHEKHLNVLQYKETFCIPERRSLPTMCSTITGDANLFSMFRLDGVPIDCPFKGGPFTFTYNRGHGDCRYPVSTIDTCIHPSRLLFNYQACPDVPRSESTVEELQCLAVWKEGSSRYLLGLIQYRHHSSYEERFRCFVFEKSKKGVMYPQGSPQSFANTTDFLFRVAQSGDATCNGLSAFEGSRTMLLKKAPTAKPCQFPSWLQVHAQWHTLDQRSTFVFEMSSLRVSNSSDLAGISPKILAMTAICSQIQENPTLDKVMLILHTTSECRNGFICTSIYRRDGHIVEMQMGTMARRADDACHISYFNQSLLPYVTLVSSTPESRQCPNLGRFAVTGLAKDGRKVKNECSTEGFTTLRVGCTSLDTLQFRSDCSSRDILSEYSCHGSWEEQGVSYLITTPLSRASTGARRYCFVFRETLEPLEAHKLKGRLKTNQLRMSSSGNSNGNTSPSDEDTSAALPDADSPDDAESDYKRILHFSSIADSCRRNVAPGVEGHLAFNVTSHGRCDDISATPHTSSYPKTALVLTLPFILIALSPIPLNSLHHSPRLF